MDENRSIKIDFNNLMSEKKEIDYRDGENQIWKKNQFLGRNKIYFTGVGRGAHDTNGGGSTLETEVLVDGDSLVAEGTKSNIPGA